MILCDTEIRTYVLRNKGQPAAARKKWDFLDFPVGLPNLRCRKSGTSWVWKLMEALLSQNYHQILLLNNSSAAFIICYAQYCSHKFHHCCRIFWWHWQMIVALLKKNGNNNEKRDHLIDSIPKWFYLLPDSDRYFVQYNFMVFLSWVHAEAWQYHYFFYCFLMYHIRSNYSTYPYKRTVKKFRSLQITASVLFVYFLIKAYVVGTHLNCINLLMQFKWVLTTYACIKKIRKKMHIHHQISLSSDLFYCVSLEGRYIFYHKWVFPVILKNLSAQCGN